MIRRLTQNDLSRLKEFWTQYWGGEIMIIKGETIQYHEVEGFIYGDWIGVLTFLIRNDECEVTSFNSLEQGKGIGRALMDEMVREAKVKNCKRIHLLTTNDNLNALKFYQKYGFEIERINRGAINESRKQKPSIPLVGMNGIPLRDEIELELRL